MSEYRVEQSENQTGNDITKYPQTKAVVAVLALLTIIHHVSVSVFSEYLYGKLLKPFEYIGIFCVGFFMFLLGYTAMKDVTAYGWKVYARRNILPILVSFFFCSYAYMIVTQLLGERYAMKELLLSFFGLILLNDQMWIAVEVILLNLFVAFTFYKGKNTKTATVLFAVCMLFMMTGSLLLGHQFDKDIFTNWFYGEWWYNTTICFFLGMLYRQKQTQVDSWLKKYFLPAFMGGLVLLAVTGYAAIYIVDHYGYWTETPDNPCYGDKLLTLLAQIPAIMLFVLLMVLVIGRFRFGGRVTEAGSAIYLELILLNNIFIYVCSHANVVFPKWVFIILEVVFTYIAAIILYNVKRLILKGNQAGHE